MSVDTQPAPSDQRVTVTDIDMPFWSMVSFMLKLALAAVPAILILAFLFSVIGGTLALWGISRSL